MKRTSLILSATFLSWAPVALVNAQDGGAAAVDASETTKPEEAKPGEKEAINRSFKPPESLKKLSTEDRRKFLTNLSSAQAMMAKRRVQEAMHFLYEAELMVPDHMIVHSLMGNGFVHLRDFEEARKSYARAQELFPTFSTEFNLAEVEFVSGSFEKAGALFGGLLENEDISDDQRKLIAYKHMICLIEQDKRDEAKRLLKAFSPMDEKSPIFFFTQAAMAFHDQNYDQGFGWIEDARVSFPGPVVAVYVDSITEVYSRRDATGRLKAGNLDGNEVDDGASSGGEEGNDGAAAPLNK